MESILSKLEGMAERLRVLGHPVRIQILLELDEGSKNVGELTELLGIAQPTMSQHLSILRSQGWVVKQRRALHAYYALASEGVTIMLKQLHVTMEQD